MKPFEVKKILVPVDFSGTSLNALDHAVHMAKINDAGLTLIHVVEGLLATSDPEYFAITRSIEYENDILEQSKVHLKELARKVSEKGVSKVDTIAVIGRTHQEIMKACGDVKADIIVMGTHGVSGFIEFVVGSNTYRVVNDAECPVLSIRHTVKTPGFKTIFVPFNSQAHSREGVMYAIRMAQLYKATLYVLGIDVENSEASLRTIELQANQIKTIVEEYGLKCNTEVVSEGYFADQILEHAKKINADLIIEMTGMERLSIAEYFMQSFEKRMINHSEVPVLSIRSTFNTDTVDMRFY